MTRHAGTGAVARFWLRTRGSRTWRAIPRELALVAGGVVLYFGVRGLTVGNVDVALRHAQDVVTSEKGLGIYAEPSMQDLVDDSHWLMTLMNWVYVWGHWPVIATTLFWLVLEHPTGYRVTRNAMLASGAIGLVVFAFFPVAPPRLADLGLIDTVTNYSSAYRVLQPHAFVNQYAAMPSLHVGWDLLIGIALVTYGRHPAARLLGVLLPGFMAVSVLATANHYITDVVAGIALVLACRTFAQRLERQHTERHDGQGPAAPSRPLPHVAAIPWRGPAGSQDVGTFAPTTGTLAGLNLAMRR
jgi:hypothetical protein